MYIMNVLYVLLWYVMPCQAMPCHVMYGYMHACIHIVLIRIHWLCVDMYVCISAHMNTPIGIMYVSRVVVSSPPNPTRLPASQ